MVPNIETTSQALRKRLDLLYAERVVADATTLSHDSSYMRDLRDELNEVYSAWAMATVMEIAMRRARVDGPLFG